jgi:two-component system alkaline phosphatase synthesis response regulator PhoP
MSPSYTSVAAGTKVWTSPHAIGIPGVAATKQGWTSPRRILVVDDNLDNVRSLALLFNTMGHHVDYAINGTAAISMAKAMNPDIIFLDLLLPDGHGAMFCKEIRQWPEFKSTRIFAITACNRMIDHQMALDAGCDDVLLKPIATRVYERLLANGFSRRKLRDFMGSLKSKPGSA